MNPRKSVSRRRKKKGRLRRDDLVRLSRGNRRDPALPPLSFFAAIGSEQNVSRRRKKKGRLRRDERAVYRGVTKGTQRSALCPYSKTYRAVAKRRGAYAAMNVWGYRGVTEGTPRSALCPYSKTYRAVAKRRGAYAAMNVWGYRGVTKGTPRSALCPYSKTYRAVAKRRGAYAAMLVFSKVGVPRRAHFPPSVSPLRHIFLQPSITPYRPQPGLFYRRKNSV